MLADFSTYAQILDAYYYSSNSILDAKNTWKAIRKVIVE